MQGSGKSHHNESSLLLKPSSLMTWSNASGNSLFMPLVVESHDVNMMKQVPLEERQNGVPSSRSNEPLFTPNVSKEQYVSDTRSISQLQQPLMPVKSTSPAVQSSKNSTLSEEVSVQELCPPPSAPQVQHTAFSQFATAPMCQSTNLEVQQCQPYCSTNLGVISTEPATVTPSYDSPEQDFQFPAQGFTETNPFESNVNFTSEVFVYHPVVPHWFYKEIVEHKEVWYGFSPMDSDAIEKAYQRALEQNTHEATVVPVVGGRYDVYIQQRERVALYWTERTAPVRRCTWFYRIEGSQRYLPYDEIAAYSLEEVYRKCATTGKWHQRVLLNGGEVVMIEGPHTIMHYAHGLDSWPTVVDVKIPPKVAVRQIPTGTVFLPNETKQIDHLVFVVQGIGSFCDLSFRTVYQCVDGFRDIANNLIPTHFKSEYENNVIGRAEFLPLAWHASLHTDDVGFDRKMKSITLPSIPKLRYFTNDTLLDILLYSSPTYCQAIIDTVTSNLNRLYNLFLSRNPHFVGQVSVAGHSLGSLILFDILSNQAPLRNVSENLEDGDLQDVSLSNTANNANSRRSSTASSLDAKKTSPMTIESVFESLSLQGYLETFLNEKIDVESLMFCGETELKDLGLPMGPRKKLLAFIKKQETQDHFTNAIELVDGSTDPRTPEAFPPHSTPYFSPPVYPYNSPYNALSSVSFPRLEFNPACFFALGSPIAMFLAVRGFSTISEDFCFPTCHSFFHIFHPYDPVAFRIEPLIDPKFSAKAVLIPHHKGRKRMHLEIRESIAKMGSELKQRLLETLKFTWSHINLFTKGGNISSEAVEAEVDKIVQEQIKNQIEEDYQESSVENLSIGQLNRGRRIDYVLQEKPIEALNEYIFALTSHATYWNSEDTVLMILREVYAVQGILPKPSESRESVQDFTIPYQHLSSTPFLKPHDATLKPTSNTASHGDFLESNFQQAGISQPPLVNSTGLSNEALVSFGNADSYHASQASLPTSQLLGPPPLSGFVRKSPFTKP